MKEFDVKNIIFSSSATVYGSPQYLPVDENHPIGGCTNAYGKTKYFIEEIIRDLCNADKVCCASFCFFQDCIHYGSMDHMYYRIVWGGVTMSQTNIEQQENVVYRLLRCHYVLATSSFVVALMETLRMIFKFLWTCSKCIDDDQMTTQLINYLRPQDHLIGIHSKELNVSSFILDMAWLFFFFFF